MPAARAYAARDDLRRSSTRPSGLRDAAQELAEKIAKNSPAAMRATKQALWGALEHGLTDACRAGAQRARRRCGATPTRPKARSRSPRSATPDWVPLDWRRDARDATRRSTRLIVERHGPVGWLINNRPDQLNAMNGHMRDEFARRVDGARRRPRGAGDRAHRRGPRVPDRRRRHRDRHRRRRAWSATASRSRTGTCTSPRGTSRCGSR